ncbi:MAG TPA: cyclic-phosphate processing receiver domain-containing protein [Gemmataceae bacterium]|nr:cyclic-phosphate processing receiver domain-containing protein [Gemmataceae bacterium]
MRALILEDNRDRRVAMIGRLAERFPFLHVTFFDASKKMIEFMESDKLQDIAMISLDHDLELISGSQGDWIDAGTGLDVARWLSKRPKPICPVVVHTTNSRAGGKMMRLLERSNWVAHRVIPHDDLLWIDTDWFRVTRNAIVDFAPQRRSPPILQVENKVSLIRSLLEDRYDSGQAFCKAAIAIILDAYVRDLRPLSGDVSAEVISFVNKDVLASVLDFEGPVVRWWREVGFSLRSLDTWAERGPLAPEQLGVGEEAAERLSRSGVKQIQIRVIEIAEMQALLVVSATRSLAPTAVQEIITELKKAIEIAVFVGLHWLPSGKQSKLTQKKKRKGLT